MNGKSKKPQYKIHYKGWNKRWDEWVDHGRLLKINASNLQIMAEKKSQNRENQLKQQQALNASHHQSHDGSHSASTSSSHNHNDSKKRKSRGSSSSKHGSSPSTKRRRINNDEDEKQKDSGKGSSGGDTLSAPLEIKLPSTLKRKLIADWEQITKHKLVITLPRTSGTRVCNILKDFEQFAVNSGQDKNIVAEIVRGIQDYFNQALQVTLLYKLERSQLSSISAKHKDLSMDQIYGVEHLCRLFVKLPQLLSPSDLDVGTRQILKSQIEFMLDFVLQKEEYWKTEYVSASTR